MESKKSNSDLFLTYSTHAMTVFSGKAVEVGVSMYVLSISSLSEVEMVLGKIIYEICIHFKLVFDLNSTTCIQFSLVLVFIQKALIHLQPKNNCVKHLFHILFCIDYWISLSTLKKFLSYNN